MHISRTLLIFCNPMRILRSQCHLSKPTILFISIHGLTCSSDFIGIFCCPYHQNNFYTNYITWIFLCLFSYKTIYPSKFNYELNYERNVNAWYLSLLLWFFFDVGTNCFIQLPFPIDNMAKLPGVKYWNIIRRICHAESSRTSQFVHCSI